MQKKTNKSKIILIACTAIFAVASFYAVLSFGPSILQAQSFDFESRAQEDAQGNDASNAQGSNFGDIDILELAFPNDKSGCMNKAGMFLAASKSYQDGKAIDDIVPIKMLRPVFEGYYEALRKDGVVEASWNNLEEFQSCIKTSDPLANAQKEKELMVRVSGCDAFSDVAFDILDSIKRRQKFDTVYNKYKNKQVDLTGSAFEDLEDPAIFFAGQLYSKARSGGYDSASEMATTLVLSCYM